MSRVRKFLHIGKAWDYIAHRRMIAFWAVMAVMLPLPWLVPACTTSHPPAFEARYDNCQVLKVYDGDTITVSCQGEKIKVRLYCIDAPEMGQEPWGRESRDTLREMVGNQVDLEKKANDRYGRTVAVVWSGGQNMNLSLVQKGAAARYPRYCSDPAYSKAESAARSDRAGIWRMGGNQQHPWEWRKQ